MLRHQCQHRQTHHISGQQVDFGTLWLDLSTGAVKQLAPGTLHAYTVKQQLVWLDRRSHTATWGCEDVKWDILDAPDEAKPAKCRCIRFQRHGACSCHQDDYSNVKRCVCGYASTSAPAAVSIKDSCALSIAYCLIVGPDPSADFCKVPKAGFFN